MTRHVSHGTDGRYSKLLISQKIIKLFVKMFSSYEKRCVEQLEFSPWTKDAEVNYIEVLFDDQRNPCLTEGRLSEAAMEFLLRKVGIQSHR